MSDALLALQAVCFGYQRDNTFLGPIDLSVTAGECWAVVGPNGAGKSTLLRLMAGLVAPTTGQVQLGARPIGDWSLVHRSRRIAFLPQRVPTDLDLTAREIVLLGRYPHRSMGLFETAADSEAADRVMAITATLPFARSPLRTLSGGEAQRVHLAAALAQDPRLLLLDEPTAAMDLRHQLSMLQLLREQVDHAGVTVVFVAHDLNLASQFATHVLVLHEGKMIAVGAPDRVLLPQTLEPVYGLEFLSVPIGDETGQTWLAPRLSRGDLRK